MPDIDEPSILLLFQPPKEEGGRVADGKKLRPARQVAVERSKSEESY
jgi:hypothetical protein